MKMRAWFAAGCMIFGAWPALAIDSYRYLHVSIETPWMIFIGLFFFVMAPMALAAVLYWYYAKKDEKEGKERTDDGADA